MTYQIITPKDSNDFDRYYYFRWEYLRKPLDKQLGSEQDDIEYKSIHRMVIDKNKNIIAVGRVHNNTPVETQVRYFAVDKKYRRNGLGTHLMKDLERIALTNNSSKMILNARVNAIKFYEKLGYKISKKTNLLFGKIQHYEMKKVL